MSMTLPLWRVMQLTEDPGTGENIGLDAYPVLEEKDRQEINRLIINHFYLREIGQETISIFTFFLARTMREIMPTYNQLYRSAKIDFDPLATYDLTTVRNGTAAEQASQSSTTSGTASDTRDGTSSDNTTSTNSAQTASEADAGSRSVYFDTPQTALARDKDYAANATDAESKTVNTGSSSGTGSGTAAGTSHETGSRTNSSTGSGNTTSTGTTEDTSRTTGFQGSAADLLNRYRSTILNIDRMLLEDPELNACFMLVWDNAAEPIQPPRRFRLGALPLN